MCGVTRLFDKQYAHYYYMSTSVTGNGPESASGVIVEDLMQLNQMICLTVALAACCAGQSQADNGDVARALNWTKSQLTPANVKLPFSFEYNGTSSDRLLHSWKTNMITQTLDSNRQQITLSFTDPDTKLSVRCEAVQYKDFPTVEWTVYLKNTGPKDTPIISNLQALNIDVKRDDSGDFLLHHNAGSGSTMDFRPYETAFTPGTIKHFSGTQGRPMVVDIPYFNLECGGQGIIVVIGWPGQWTAEFARGTDSTMHIQAGQETTHFKLHPGEEVRTPRVVLQFYKGKDWISAQNTWRRWMIAHNMPRPGGKLPSPLLAAASSQQYGEMLNGNEQNQIMMMDRYLEEGIKLDYWWMDIGWYDPPMLEGRWVAGTWKVDRKRFPNGLKAVDDHARSKGMKGIVVWFEPEHVWPGTELYEEHSNWLLTPPNDPAVIASINQGQPVGPRRLLNLGNPDAREWITDRFSQIITDEGIDIYRQDFNIEPLIYWNNADSEDRQGITENKYIVGYLTFWDELLRRHPNMLIDSCASGGRRNDIETMRRSVPLWRTDSAFDPVVTQCHTYGLSMWLPFSGTGARELDSYTFRSNMTMGISLNDDVRRTDLDYDNFRKMVSQWRSVSPNYYGDYYPLTPYSTDNNVWMAWQFDRPEAGEGMVQAFRRADCTGESINLKLRGLDSKAEYSVTDLDTNSPVRISGRELMEKGLTVTSASRPYAATITYKKMSK